MFIAFLLFSGLIFLLFKRNKTKKYREDKAYLSLSAIGILVIGGGSIISALILIIGFNLQKTTTITAFVVPFSAFLTYWSMGNID